VIKDAALFTWGGGSGRPRAPGLSDAVEILGKRIPVYDLLLMPSGGRAGADESAAERTRWGALVRAATQDREMVGALASIRPSSSRRSSSSARRWQGWARAADSARARNLDLDFR